MTERDFLPEAISIAKGAGAILRNYVGRSLGIEHKGRVDLVTEADRASEDYVLREIRDRFPDHGVLSEESGATEHDDPKYLWIVDPLDGTTNFAHGLPIWSVSIAITCGGEPVVGVVYDPSRDELFAAAKGQGATLNGKPISVSDCLDLEKALLVTGFPYDVQTSDDNNLDHFRNFMMCARSVRRLGSAALDLSYVAAGRFDGFWEKKLAPWDVAAGILLVREAGGTVVQFSQDEVHLDQGEVIASSAALVAPIRQVLRDGPPSD